MRPLAARSPWVIPALAALAALPCVTAVLQLGRLHPDEVYQFLEPAFYRVRGYGVLAWEWHEGLRNWAVPLVLSLFLRLSDAMHVESPRVYRAVIELPQFALHLWSLRAVYQYARRKLSGEREARNALAVALLVGLYGPLLAYAGRTLGEAISTSFLLVSLEALDREDKRPWSAGALGGLGLGLAVVVRYGSAVMVLAALVWIGLHRRWRVLAACGGAGLLVAGALGALDWATWGRPFHSLLAYTRYNVFSHDAATRFGAQPGAFFLPFVVGLTPLWAWWGLVHTARTERPRLPLGLFMGLVYLIAISLTPHKEERFLYPAAVLWTVDGAAGLLAALRGVKAATTRRGAILAVALLLTLAPYPILAPKRGDQFRAIVAATRAPDVRGLLIVNEGVWGAGGSFYLGKNIPWTVCDWPQDLAFQRAMGTPQINRVVTYEDRGFPELLAAGFHVVERVGQATWLAR